MSGLPWRLLGVDRSVELGTAEFGHDANTSYVNPSRRLAIDIKTEVSRVHRNCRLD